MDNNKKNIKQFLKTVILALVLFIAGIFISVLGETNSIPLIQTLGYMTAGLSGTVFFGFWIEGNKGYIFNSWKKCLILLIIAVLTAIPLTLLLAGKLW